ncbi:MAG TPA: glycosyltransferase family 4 protein [Steroidobacteraceae bacterium]|nr:glycosyltransferase family 4 protein [Steroidobacteraceae bacterium]
MTGPDGGEAGERGSRPFRLLVLASDTYPPQRVDVTILFGEELAGRGHRIDLILQSEAACERGYVAPWGGGQVWVAPADRGDSLLRRFRKHLSSIRYDAKLFGLLRSGRYDAIEVKDKFISALLAAIAARLYRKRFIYWLSYPFPEFYLMRARQSTARYPLLYRIRGEAFRFLLYRIVLPAADHVFVQSEKMRQDVAAQGIPLAKLTAVPMGIRIESLGIPAEAAGRSLIGANEPRVLYLGSLARERHIEFLLRTFARVLAQIPQAKLYLVGSAEDPKDEQYLVDEARRLGVLASVVFSGQLPQREAFRLVREADVCVSPLYPTPIYEVATPTKLVEYMAQGKAVVANTHPDQRMLIEESGCGYCVPYEEQPFAEAIVKLLGAPELAREMGERGRRYAVANRGYPAIADVVEREMLRIVAGVNP